MNVYRIHGIGMHPDEVYDFAEICVRRGKHYELLHQTFLKLRCSLDFKVFGVHWKRFELHELQRYRYYLYTGLYVKKL